MLHSCEYPVYKKSVISYFRFFRNYTFSFRLVQQDPRWYSNHLLFQVIICRADTQCILCSYTPRQALEVESLSNNYGCLDQWDHMAGSRMKQGPLLLVRDRKNFLYSRDVFTFSNTFSQSTCSFLLTHVANPLVNGLSQNGFCLPVLVLCYIKDTWLNINTYMY